jgi:uncharacterized membrane protein YqjE
MLTPSDERSPRSLSTRALIGEILAKASLLVKKEVELARAEIREDLSAELGMAKALGIAAILALLAVNAFVVAGILALAAVLPGWAAGLIVGGALLTLAAVVGLIGWRRRVAEPLDVTRQSLKEDLQWMKERAA